MPPSDTSPTGLLEKSLVRPEAIASRLEQTTSLVDFFPFWLMCASLLALKIFLFCVRGFADPDIWWHLRNAQFLFTRHAIPRVDSFSFGAAGSPWMNHEWLSEIPYYVAFQAMGLPGIFTVYFVTLLLIYAGVYYLIRRAGADSKNAAIATILAIALGTVSFGPRTLLFGWLCLVVLLMVLERFQRAGKGLWMLPPLFLVWINLHGSWVFGMVVLAIAIASGLMEGQWGRIVARRWSAGEMRGLCLATAASVCALFVNPFGYKLVLYPFDLLFRQPGNMALIDEWQPVNFHDTTGKLVLAMLALVFACLLLSNRRWRLADALLLAFAMWTALDHVRMLFFAGIILAIVLGPTLKLLTPYRREHDKPLLNAAIVLAVLVFVVMRYPSQKMLTARVEDNFPQAALTFLQQHKLQGRIFNHYEWGGYMDWASPEWKPFIDGRTDIFVYNGTFNDYFNAATNNHPLELLDKHRIDYLLLTPNEPLAYIAGHSPAWQNIYSDKIATLFRRTDSLP